MTAILEPSKYSSWDLHLPIVSFVMNNTKQAKTGFSAHELLFGKNMNQPSDLISQLPLPHYSYHSNIDKNKSIIAYKQRSFIRNITNRARLTITRINNNTTKSHNKLSNNPEPYNVGDHCLIMKHVTGHKYENKWSGPFMVTKCIKPYLYKIRTNNTDKIVNIKIMKRYTPNKYSDLPSMNEPTTSPPSPKAPVNIQSHTTTVPTSDIDDSEVLHNNHLDHASPIGLIAPQTTSLPEDVSQVTIQPADEPIEELREMIKQFELQLENERELIEPHPAEPIVTAAEREPERKTREDPLQDIPWPNMDYEEPIPTNIQLHPAGPPEPLIDLEPVANTENDDITVTPEEDIQDLESLSNLESIDSLAWDDQAESSLTEQELEEPVSPLEITFQEIPRRATRARKPPVWANDYVSGAELD